MQASVNAFDFVQANSEIAAFMGHTVVDHQVLSGGYLRCVKQGMAHIPITWDEFSYHSNWNVLMPVVRRILYHRSTFPYYCKQVCDLSVSEELSTVYFAVVRCVRFLQAQR